ncbi:mitochondrial import receptor subunit Tom22 [Entomophthora muscae]|uniref:Mitochondrial import receptor subunit Tom22 n=1 Tax=Entomophthora muscae TaxID=34485 RepID=A0ACC2SDC9_9FUNG|nr:mitochondrial import receptor subunit Tom22 [Entomophthora muscae]
MVKLHDMGDGYNESVIIEDEYTDSDHEESEFDDDDEIEEETFWERLKALQDIIPITQRRKVSNFVGSIFSTGASVLRLSGKTAWVLSTTAFVVVLPLLYELERNDTTMDSVNAPLDPSSQVNSTIF